MVKAEMDLRWIDSAFIQLREWRFGGIIISTMEMGSSQCATNVPFIVIRELIDLTHLQGSYHKCTQALLQLLKKNNAIFLKYFD